MILYTCNNEIYTEDEVATEFDTYAQDNFCEIFTDFLYNEEVGPECYYMMKGDHTQYEYLLEKFHKYFTEFRSDWIKENYYSREINP